MSTHFVAFVPSTRCFQMLDGTMVQESRALARIRRNEVMHAFVDGQLVFFKEQGDRVVFLTGQDPSEMDPPPAV